MHFNKISMMNLNHEVTICLFQYVYFPDFVLCNWLLVHVTESYFFLVCFDLPQGKLLLALFNQYKEVFPLTTNLMLYETYARKYRMKY